jgi:hypothetical protein
VAAKAIVEIIGRQELTTRLTAIVRYRQRHVANILGSSIMGISGARRPAEMRKIETQRNPNI